MSRIIKASSIVAFNENISNLINKQYDADNKYREYGDYLFIKSFLNSLQDDTDIYRVKLYVSDNLKYSNENDYLYNFTKSQNSTWYNRMKNENLSFLCCPGSYLDENDDKNNILSVIRIIPKADNYQQHVGAVRIDFLKNSISNILSKSIFVKNSHSYIQNSKGELVTSSDVDFSGKLSINQETVNNISSSNNWTLLTLASKKYYVRCKLIQDTDWYMITVVPLDEILSDSNNFFGSMFTNMLLICFVAYIFAFLISISITKRVSYVITNMKQVQQGNFSEIPVAASKDEIGELIDNYNFMIEKIEVLIDEQYKTGKEIKAAELKVLHAQINPHFLYNTLDLVNWLAIKNKTTEIVFLVKALANFYKLSLSKGKEVIAIREELMHVTFYVQIQNMRFSDKIKLIVDVPEEIKECIILKTILQPLVENSILHGILNKPEKEGTIIIKGEYKDESILLSIIDDGIGIPENKFDKILCGEISSKSGGGFGVKNINDRIKLYYGNQYGLTFKSSSDGPLTTVEILIPIIKPE